MTNSDFSKSFANRDKQTLWHPFTPMRDWCAPTHEPLVLVSGEGAILRDSEGREYIDGNSSIWTNLHGHRHPKIDFAISEQLGKIAHTSFLGFTNPLAIQLAEELLALFSFTENPAQKLTRVFFSDDGSTAIEVALKMAAQFWQHSDQPQRQKFVAFANAYHGDTMGASSLCGVPIFHDKFSAWQFPVERVASVAELDSKISQNSSDSLTANEIAAVIIEPLIQGAGGMRLWPKGMLRELRAWCDRHDVLLILDEVMTGFGRTGTMFACEQEGVTPDFIALAKGLTGGYLPLAVTLTTNRVFEAFLNDENDGVDRTLYYGHSYCGNVLGCAAALATLAIFRDENVLENLQPKIARLTSRLASLHDHPNVIDIRQCGFIAGIEVGEKRRDANGDAKPFDPQRKTGAQICNVARKHGLLTRPVRDTITLMPPYCITDAQLDQAVRAIGLAVSEVCH